MSEESLAVLVSLQATLERLESKVDVSCDKLTDLIKLNTDRISTLESVVNKQETSIAELERRLKIIETGAPATTVNSPAQPANPAQTPAEDTFPHIETLRKSAEVIYLTDSIDQNVNLISAGRDSGRYIFRTFVPTLEKVRMTVKKHPTSPRLIVVGTGFRNFEQICLKNCSDEEKVAEMNSIIDAAATGLAEDNPNSIIAFENLSPLLCNGGNKARQVWQRAEWGEKISYEVRLPGRVAGDGVRLIATDFHSLADLKNGARVFPLSVINADGKHLAAQGTDARHDALVKAVMSLLPDGDNEVSRRLEPTFAALGKIKRQRAQSSKQPQVNTDVQKLSETIAMALSAQGFGNGMANKPPWPAHYQSGYGKHFPEMRL